MLGAGATGIAIAFWLGLAPISIGGDFSYVIVNGNSMEPHLRTGDFVLLRRESSYGLDEVVAYRDPSIGTILHRIRAKEDDRFVMRGDNRTNVDRYSPLSEDVLGREVAVWPRGLSVIMAVTSPGALGAVAFAVIAVGIAKYWTPPGPRFRRRRSVLRQSGMR